MPTPAYLSITGETQGLITQGTFTEPSVGGVHQEGHPDQILVQAFSHNVIRPRDPQSGQSSGQRVHQPMKITKVFDKCSPLLYTALTTGENLTCTIEWWRTAASGMQEHYYTIKLYKAMIVDIKGYMPNCQDPGVAHFTHLEDVSFSYKDISWTHEVSGTSGEDSWDDQ